MSGAAYGSSVGRPAGKTPATLELIGRAIAMSKQGMTPAAIAAQERVSPQYIRQKLAEAGQPADGGRTSDADPSNQGEPPPKFSIRMLNDLAMKVARSDYRLCALGPFVQWLWVNIVSEIGRLGDGFALRFADAGYIDAEDFARCCQGSGHGLVSLFQRKLLIEIEGGVALPEDLGVTPRRRGRGRPRFASQNVGPSLWRQGEFMHVIPGGRSPLEPVGGDGAGSHFSSSEFSGSGVAIPVAPGAAEAGPISLAGATETASETPGFPSNRATKTPILLSPDSASGARTLPAESTDSKYSFPLENLGIFKGERAPAGAHEDAGGPPILLSRILLSSGASEIRESKMGPPVEAAPRLVPAPRPSSRKERKALRRAERVAPLPADWQPDEALRAFATERVKNVDLLTDKFLAHHRAHGTTVADWREKYRSWVLSEARQNPSNAVATVSQAGAPQSQGAAGMSQAAPEPDPATLQGDAATWAQVRQDLKQQIGQSDFKIWVGKLTLGDRYDGAITLWAASGFLRDRIDADYGARIRKAWTRHDPTVLEVEILVGAVVP